MSAQKKNIKKVTVASGWQSRKAAYLIVAAAMIIFVWLCFANQVTQDDAYISFRYAENFLRGEGLVYNSGERVEGYTNFLWVIILAFCKRLFGIDYLISSRVLGITGGALIFYLIYLLIDYLYPRRRNLTLLIATGLLLSNFSLPYWAISSLETSAFAFITLATLAAEYRLPRLTPALLVMATLLRPEGALVFAVIFLYRAVINKQRPILFASFYLIPLLPFAAFKLLYYGSLFPNPYFAKSGVGLEYIISGAEYFLHFARTIGVYGVIFLPPLLASKRLWQRLSLLYLLLLFYFAYIVWVGGDVLKVYRFFIAPIPLLTLLFAVSLVELTRRISSKRVLYSVISSVAAIVFAGASFLLARNHINAYLHAERDIVNSMDLSSSMLKAVMPYPFTVAASTIGKMGYNLMGNRVIDMLGLTDAHIARHPEEIPGLVSSWKERKFNAGYLLTQQPDYIFFSTGHKPSAPAERALILHSEFRRCYSTTAFTREGKLLVIYRRRLPLEMSQDRVHPDPQFVEDINQGFTLLGRQSYPQAEQKFRHGLKILGEDYTLLLHSIAECQMQQGQLDSAFTYAGKALALDPTCWEARRQLFHFYRIKGDTASAGYQLRMIEQNSPWPLERW